jgi:hypothetical protein
MCKFYAFLQFSFIDYWLGDLGSKILMYFLSLKTGTTVGNFNAEVTTFVIQFCFIGMLICQYIAYLLTKDF